MILDILFSTEFVCAALLRSYVNNGFLEIWYA